MPIIICLASVLLASGAASAQVIIPPGGSLLNPPLPPPPPPPKIEAPVIPQMDRAGNAELCASAAALFQRPDHRLSR